VRPVAARAEGDTRAVGGAQALVGLALAASVAAAVVGNAFLPLLLRISPVLLLVVQSSYAQMGLAVARLDPVTFVLVAALRRWIGEVIAFAGGKVLGAEALRWYGQRSGRQVPLPTWEGRGARLLRDAVVLVVPQPLLSAAVGVSGMPWLRFVVLKLLGSLASVTLLWWAATALALPLAALADLVEANALGLTVVAIVGTAGWLVWQRRREA